MFEDFEFECGEVLLMREVDGPWVYKLSSDLSYCISLGSFAAIFFFCFFVFLKDFNL